MSRICIKVTSPPPEPEGRHRLAERMMRSSLDCIRPNSLPTLEFSYGSPLQRALKLNFAESLLLAQPAPSFWDQGDSGHHGAAREVCFRTAERQAQGWRELEETRADIQIVRQQLESWTHPAARPHKESSVRRFPARVDSWSQVTVRVRSDEQIELVAGGHREVRTFMECGMADERRRPCEPSMTWQLLLLFALHNGTLTWSDKGASPKIRTRIKEVRARLRGIFGQSADPFERYERARGWRTKFTIVDMRRHLS